jgi:hypothetical protein
MNDELQKQASDIAGWLKESAAKGGDFLAEQAPLFAQEVVAWHFWSSVFLAIVFSVVGIALAISAFVCLRYSLQDGASEGQCVCCGAAFCVCGLISMGCLLGAVPANGYEAVKAAVAPRIVIVEYAGRALGGSN